MNLRVSLIAVCLIFSAGVASGIAAESAKTQILTDEKAGIVRIVIDGKEIARFDKSGLHVEGEITYSGSLTDVGFADAE